PARPVVLVRPRRAAADRGGHGGRLGGEGGGRRGGRSGRGGGDRRDVRRGGGRCAGGRLAARAADRLGQDGIEGAERPGALRAGDVNGHELGLPSRSRRGGNSQREFYGPCRASGKERTVGGRPVSGVCLPRLSSRTRRAAYASSSCR